MTSLMPSSAIDVEVGVGQLIEPVAAIDAVPLRDATVGGRVPAEVTPVECALERDEALAFDHPPSLPRGSALRGNQFDRRRRTRVTV